MNKGFSLIELLVVIVVIALLAAYAIPTYRQYVVESKRADAHARILEIAGMHEKFYANTNAYPADLASLGLDASFLTTEDYVITSNDDPAWILTATPQGGQATSDTLCPTITLNQLGQKGPNAECWE